MLCNPDILIDWQPVPAPKFKKDYEGKLLRVPAFRRMTWHAGADLPPDGSVCRIARRFNGGGSDGFSLELSWDCPSCHKTHHSYIPESWLEENKAHFVEPCGLADYVYNLWENAQPLIFLTSSYHHSEGAKMGARAGLVAQCAAWLQQAGHYVVAPVPMIHAMDRALPDGDVSIIEHLELSLRMLEICDALCVLMLDEVRDSSLVAAELDRARSLGIPLNQISRGEDGSFSVIHNPRWWR